MRREIKILLMASVAFHFAIGFFGPLYAIFVEEIGGNVIVAGEAIAIYSIIVGSLTFLMGKAETKFSKEWAVVIGYTLGFIGITGYIFVQNVMQLFVIQAILGLGGAIAAPAWDAIYGMKVSRGKETLEWGSWEAARNIVLGISALIGGFFVAAYGFRSLFMMMSVFMLFTTLTAARLLIGKSKLRVR